MELDWQNSSERSWGDLIYAFLSEKEFDGATKSIALWRKNFPESKNPLFYQALIDYARQNLDEALKNIDEFLKYQENNLPGIVFYYFLNLKVGKIEYAQKIFAKAIKQTHSAGKVYEILGDILVHSMDMENAIKFYRKSLVFSPENAHIWASLGLAFTKIHRYDDAKISFERAEKYAKTKSELIRSAVYFIMAGETDKALEIYRSAEPGHTEDSIFWLNKGLTYIFSEQFDKAESCWNKVLSINPDFPYAHYNLACLYVREQKYDEAWGHLERAMKFSDFFIRRAKVDGDIEPLIIHPEFGKKFRKIAGNL